jgi:hypothetical protein
MTPSVNNCYKIVTACHVLNEHNLDNWIILHATAVLYQRNKEKSTEKHMSIINELTIYGAEHYSRGH